MGEEDGNNLKRSPFLTPFSAPASNRSLPRFIASTWAATGDRSRTRSGGGKSPAPTAKSERKQSNTNVRKSGLGIKPGGSPFMTEIGYSEEGTGATKRKAPASRGFNNRKRRLATRSLWAWADQPSYKLPCLVQRGTARRSSSAGNQWSWRGS